MHSVILTVITFIEKVKRVYANDKIKNKYKYGGCEFRIFLMACAFINVILHSLVIGYLLAI